MTRTHSTAATNFVVKALRPVLLSAAYKPGSELKWVGGVIASWDAALIEVTLEDGTTGIGEVGAAIMAAPAVPGIVEAFSQYVLGAGFDHPLEVGRHLRAYTTYWARGGMLNGAAGAIEVACLDAVSKREGVPAYELLGGAKHSELSAYSSGGLGSAFDEILDWATREAAAGFTTVKFRAMRDPETTIQLLHHVVPRLPKGTGFVLDAVQGSAANPWSVEDAIRVGKVASDFGAEWFEEPCFSTDIAGYAAVRAAIQSPVSGIESNGTVTEFTALMEADGVDIVQPDVSFVGGPASFAAVAREAAERGVGCIPHVWGSGVTFSANLHSALAASNVERFEYCTLPNPLREGLLAEPIKIHQGMIGAPTGPGLGVALTPEVEKEFPYLPGFGHIIS